jgi:hypothetical protein
MTWSFRQGAVVTYVREDGQPGPGSSHTYKGVSQVVRLSAAARLSIRDRGHGPYVGAG